MDLKKFSQELHKPFIKKFDRRKVISTGIDDIHSCDLVDMQEWSKENDGYKYLLNVVDVFSRYAWSIPLKTKSAAEVVDAFADIKRKPNKIWVDKGGEFYNKQMDAYISKNNIVRYSTYGEHKSAIVERFNKTLKSWMWRKFTELQTRRWIDMLPELLEKYNNKKHSSIGMSPVQASKKENEKQLLIKQYGNEDLSKDKPKFNLGDWVRISRVKGTFEKSYLPNWSAEIFKVITIFHTNPITYGLAEYNGERIEGSFYEQELQKTDLTETFLVEKVIQKRKGEVLVKWLGWNESYNSWIKESELKNFK
jgi:hypothetical protein